MIYVQARVLGGDEAAFITRSYLAAIARVTAVPVRAVWLDASLVQPELLELVVQHVYAMGSRPVGPLHCLLRVGSVAEVTAQKVEAPYTIGLTWWQPGRLPRIIRARLDRLDAVWVPSEEHKADYPKATVIPIPFDAAFWHRKHPARASIYYAVGAWGAGGVAQALDAYLTQTPADSAIMLVAPDAPFTTHEQLRDLRGLAPDAPLPSITCDHMMPATLTAVRELHCAGACYVGPPGFHAAAARAVGNRWVTPDELRSGKSASVERDPPATVEDVTARIETLLQSVTAAPLPEAAPVPAGTGPMRPVIAFVVPVRDVEPDMVSALLDALMPQIAQGDEIVISSQGTKDSAPLRTLCVQRGVTLVEDAFCGVWNIARARNMGFLALRNAPTMAPRYVMTVDADIRFPDGWVESVRDLVCTRCARETVIFVPRVCNTDGSGARIASGAALVPRGFVETARGWDEAYVGYGSEDLDLIHRMRHGLGAHLLQLDALEPITHVAHARRAEAAEYGPASVSRLEARVSGRLTGPVNVNDESWTARWLPGPGAKAAPCSISVRDGRLEHDDVVGKIASATT